MRRMGTRPEAKTPLASEMRLPLPLGGSGGYFLFTIDAMQTFTIESASAEPLNLQLEKQFVIRTWTSKLSISSTSYMEPKPLSFHARA